MDQTTAYRNLLPLSDPKTQIRLLKLHAGTGGDIIEVETSHWPLNDTPSFRAISYTWGSPDLLGTVKVDGLDWTVRANCAYALWQARLHHPDSYVWIDSICINQQDVEEKSAQVAMMGDVYAKASEVVACIGPADESSEYIHEVLADMDDYIAAYDGQWASSLPPEQRNNLWCTLGTASELRLRELFTHWNKFCERPYFSRLWIVQELWGGKRSQILMLCGVDVMLWDDLEELAMRLEQCFNRSGDMPWPDRPESSIANRAICAIADQISAFYHQTHFNFPGVLAGIGDCQDPRDKIYGILRLVDWGRFGFLCPVPDYNLTVVQVAFEAMKRTIPGEIFLAQLIARKLEVKLEDLATAFSPTRGQLSDSDTPARRRVWNTRIWGACRVYKDESRRLAVGLAEREAWMGLELTEEQSVRDAIKDPARRAWPLPFGGQNPLSLYSGPSVSVLACQETKVGDILVKAGEAGAFIMRPTSDLTVFSVVGKAIIFNRFTMSQMDAWRCDCWSQGRSGDNGRGVTLALELSDEEALSLGAAYNLEDEEDPRTPIAYASIPAPRAGTLVKDVTASTWGADQAIAPFSSECKIHGGIEVAKFGKNALHLSIEVQSGGRVQLTK